MSSKFRKKRCNRYKVPKYQNYDIDCNSDSNINHDADNYNIHVNVSDPYTKVDNDTESKIIDEAANIIAADCDVNLKQCEYVMNDKLLHYFSHIFHI